MNELIHLLNGHYLFSMSRFSDDFTELVLSYLPIEDKIRLQCVSKDWKRLMFARHRDLIVGRCGDNIRFLRQLISLDRTVNETALSTFLSNWPQTNKIVFHYGLVLTDSLLDALIVFCERLEFIAFNLRNVSKDVINRFGYRFRSSIKSIQFNDQLLDDPNKQIQLLAFCKGLESLSCDLRLSQTLDQLIPLMALKSLQCFGVMTNQFLAAITRLAPNLECLDLSVISNERQNMTDISQLLVNSQALLPKLIRLGLDISHISCLLFHKLSKLFPNIQSLKLIARCEVSDHSLYSLTAMHTLRRLNIYTDSKNNMTDISIALLLDNCPLLNNIELHFRPNITLKSLAKLMQISSIRPNVRFTFKCFGPLFRNNLQGKAFRGRKLRIYIK